MRFWLIKVHFWILLLRRNLVCIIVCCFSVMCMLIVLSFQKSWAQYQNLTFTLSSFKIIMSNREYSELDLKSLHCCHFHGLCRECSRRHVNAESAVPCSPPGFMLYLALITSLLRRQMYMISLTFVCDKYSQSF